MCCMRDDAELSYVLSFRLPSDLGNATVIVLIL